MTTQEKQTESVIGFMLRTERNLSKATPESFRKVIKYITDRMNEAMQTMDTHIQKGEFQSFMATEILMEQIKETMAYGIINAKAKLGIDQHDNTEKEILEVIRPRRENRTEEIERRTNAAAKQMFNQMSEEDLLRMGRTIQTKINNKIKGGDYDKVEDVIALLAIAKYEQLMNEKLNQK